MADLIASVQDGRLAEEVQRMRACGRLDVQVVLVEGRPNWTIDGVLLGRGFGAQWTVAQHRGLLWSVRDMGVWVDTTDDLADTANWLTMFDRWCAKDRHYALIRRPGAVSAWGKPDNREYGIHLLQGLPGVGPEIAERIWDKYGVPWAWTISESELKEVEGIGVKKATMMLSMLNGSREIRESSG
jgi:ERCC4-type nuclease